MKTPFYTIILSLLIGLFGPFVTEKFNDTGNTHLYLFTIIPILGISSFGLWKAIQTFNKKAKTSYALIIGNGIIASHISYLIYQVWIKVKIYTLIQFHYNYSHIISFFCACSSS